RELLGVGEYVEVFVYTPLELCMQRDPKGLYTKAIAGKIRNFTGVDSPYEPPEAAQLVLPTAEASAEESAETVLAWLQEGGYIRAWRGAEANRVAFAFWQRGRPGHARAPRYRSSGLAARPRGANRHRPR